jgi:chromate transporter
MLMPRDAASADREPSTAAWKTWLAVGATGFGGPAGQVAILHREVVERKRWLT